MIKTHISNVLMHGKCKISDFKFFKVMHQHT